MSKECASISLTNIVVKDIDTLEKFDLLVNYAVLQKLGIQMLSSKIELTYLVTVKCC